MKPPLIRYGIDDRPPLGTLLLFGLQWLAVVGVSTIVMGKVLAALHFTAPADQFLYMQKLFFATGVALLAQLFVGHRLPLVIGPAAILLVGILASGARDTAALYSSIMIGGALLALLCATGLFRYVARLFTYRVVATILMLIAIAITPTVLALVVDAPEPRDAVRHLLFALGLLVAMVAGDRLLRGAWRATLLLWALALGSALCFWLLPDTAPSAAPADQPLFASLFRDVTAPLHWDLGLILSFLICFIALAVNDLGSIESLGKLLQPPAMAQRLTRGMTVTGLANVLAGFLGVVGVVNFSLSAGIISANGNASRLSFLPAALCLVLMAFSPSLIALFWMVPPVVIGAVLLYIMSLQLATGFLVALGERTFGFPDALVISIPVMLSVLVSFLPQAVVAAFPPLLVPIAGNGFVIGTLAVLLLEHVLLRPKRPARRHGADVSVD